MDTVRRYESPLGGLLLASYGEALTGLSFTSLDTGLNTGLDAGESGIPSGNCRPLDAAAAWLDAYFSGQKPDFTPPLHMTGTAFAQTVWDLLLQIPYGTVVTYGELARRTAARLGTARMSAQAVGGALARNPIPILVPCHRVVGTGGSLTGYTGGLERKARLLELEGVDFRRLFPEAVGKRRLSGRSG